MGVAQTTRNERPIHVVAVLVDQEISSLVWRTFVNNAVVFIHATILQKKNERISNHQRSAFTHYTRTQAHIESNSVSTLSWQFILNSAVEICGVRSVEFFPCMVSETWSHGNPHDKPGDNKGCWTCYNAENVKGMWFKRCGVFCFSAFPCFELLHVHN